MDILNFISWVKGSRIVTSVDGAQTLLPVGLKDPKRDDGYLAGAISVSDLTSAFTPTFTNNNVPYGENTLSNINVVQGNVAIGYQAANALQNGNNFNVAVGFNSMGFMNYGSENVAVGNSTLRIGSNSSFNTALGNQAMYNTYGSYTNVAVGLDCMFNSSDSNRNVAIGNSAGRFMSSAYENIFIGNNTASLNWINGDRNIAIGHETLNRLTTGSNNIVLGDNSLRGCTVGYNNIALGINAGSNVVTGYSNIFIGNNINSVTTYVTNSVAIGSSAIVDQDNQLSIGSSAIPLGTVTTETVSSTRTWTVKINGTIRKILLA